MPQYQVEIPGQGKFQIDSPTELTDAQVYAAIQGQLSAAPPEGKTGLGAALGKGLESTGSQLQSGIAGLFGSPEQAATAGIERGKAIGEKYAEQVSFDKLKKAFDRGILPAAGELASQVPLAIAEQLPNLGVMAAGAKAGSMAGAPFGALGRVVGGGVGAIAPSFIQQFGGNIERQAQTQAEAGQPLSVDKGSALAAAAPQAALDVVSTYIPLGGRLVSKLVGIPEKALIGDVTGKAAKLAEERLLATLAKGTATGVLAEVPTEVTQQMLERAQAGLSLTSPDALKEYGETAYQTSLLGPLGAAGRLSERAGARLEVGQKATEDRRQAQLDQLKQQETDQQQQQQAATDLEAKRQTPEYAQEIAQKYADLMQQRTALQEKARAKVDKDDLLGMSEKKDAAKALSAFTNSEEFKSVFEEYRRVRPMLQQIKAQEDQAKAQAQAKQALGNKSPQEVFLERMGLGEAPAAEGSLEDAFPKPHAVTTPAAPTTPIDTAVNYAQQQIALANQRGFAETLDPKDRPALYASYLMETPGLARQLVELYGQAFAAVADQELAEVGDLQKLIDKQREQNAAIGLTTAQLTAQESLRLRDALATAEQTLQLKIGAGLQGAELDIYTQKVEALRELIKLRDSGAVQQAVVDEAKAAADEWKKTVDSIQNGLTDALYALPGMRKSESNAVLAGLKLQLDSLGGEISKTRGMRSIEQTALDAKIQKEREALGQMREAPGYLQGAAQERITDKADTAQRAVLSGQLTAPVQEQLTLGLEGPPSGERTYTRDRTPDQNALTQAVQSVRQRAELSPEDTKLLDAIEDNLPQISKDRGVVSEEPRRPVGYRTPADTLRKAPESTIQQTPLAKDVASWLYSLQIGRRDDTLARQISQRLEGYQRGKLSETEAVTQLARRRLTEEEQKSLEGTTLGPRGETKIKGTEVDTTIANFAKQAKIGTPIREATDEIQRAVQSELPLADRKGATSVSFRNWKEFQDYLSGQALQLLRAATADVNNGAYPNIHRAAVQIGKMSQRAAEARAKFDALIKLRKELLAGPEADAKAAAQLLAEAGKLLETKLVLTDDFFPGKATQASVVEHIASAQQKLDTAEKTRDQLLLQFKNNIDTFEGAIQAYEKGRAATVTTPAKGTEPSTVMLGYEAENLRRREASQEAIKEARDNLKEVVDNLIAHQKWLKAAQKSVNFIDKETSVPEAAFRRKKLQELLDTIPKLQQQLARQNASFMRVVSRSISKPYAKSPVLKDSVFKNFLVQEAKLTDLINAQNKSLSGLRLNLYTARTRLNDAHLSFEDAGGTVLQQARNNLLAAEALYGEVQRTLTATREIAPSPAQEQRLAKEAGDLEAFARSTQQKVDKIHKRKVQPVAEKETQADREARDAQLRREEQARLERAEEPVAGPSETPRGVYAEKPLEERQQEGTPIPREQVFMDARRKIRQEIQDKVDKLSALRDIAEDADSTLEERVEATNEFAKLYAATQGKLERRDARLSNAFSKQKNLVDKLKELRNTLAQESVLSENQQKRYKNKPEVLAEKEAAQRAQIQKQIAAQFEELNKATAFLSANRGIERVQVATKAERAEGRAAPREIEEVLTPAGERIAQTQTTKRQIGPLTKRGTVPPEQMLTGSEESRAGKTTIGTRNQPRETAGSTQRNVALTRKEAEEANQIALEFQLAANIRMGGSQKDIVKASGQANKLLSNILEKKTRINEIDTQLAFIKANPSKTDEGKARQKATSEKIIAEKKALEAALGILKEEQESIVSDKETGDAPLKEKVDVEDSAAAVMQNIAKTTTSPIARAVAEKLKMLLGSTQVRIVKDLTDYKGNPVYGSSAVDGSVISLDEAEGLTEVTFLHEGVHAAVERVLRMPEDQLTDRQRAAKRELEALFDAIKDDDTITNENAKTSMSEFLSEALSDGALQVQLREKPWTLKNAWEALKNGILKLLGIETPKNMLEATLASADALMTKVVRPTEADATLQVVNRPKYSNAALAAAGEVGDRFIAKNRTFYDSVKANGSGLAFETQLVDRFAGFERLAKRMPALLGSQMMYYLRMYDQRMNFVSQSVSNGALNLREITRSDGMVERVIESKEGASIKGVAEILREAKNIVGSVDGTSRLFTLYMSGIRAKQKGFDTLHFGEGLTEADLLGAVKTVENTANLKEIFDRARAEYNAYNRGLISFAVQTGALSKELAANLLKDNDYIPWYRQRNGVAELIIGKEAPIRIGNISEQPYLQELVGDSKPILDFLTSSVQNTNLLTEMALRNLATKNAVIELTKIDGAKIGKGRAAAGPNVVKFKVDGEDRFALIDTDKYGIDADLLVKGMEGIPTQMPLVFRMLGAPANLLRKAVTLSPMYAAKQLFRDSLAAPILAGADFIPITGALKELSGATKKILESRGITGGQVFTGTSADLSKILRDITSGKPGWMSALSKLEAMSMEADALTRRAQYNSYIKQGLSEMEATLMALESMNFNKRGASPSIHILNSLIPFFNAQIQSMNVLYKALTGKLPFNEKLKIQEKLLARGFMVAGVSLSYAAAMQDDEAYKNATPDQKYSNWFVRIPGVDEPIKLPIPFEIGYIFKALPEAIYNTLATEHGGEDAAEAFRHILLQTIPGGSSYGVPQAMRPALEVGLGRSFYTGRDILSQHEKTLLPEAQFRENTTEIAKYLGKKSGISPISIDALVQGYTGTMGLAFVQALSTGITPSEGPEKAVKRLSDMPVVGGLFQPNDAGNIISKTYDRMLDIKKLDNTVNELINKGQKAEALALVNSRSREYAASEVADYYTTTIREITQAENAVRASNMSPEQKRAKLDELRGIKIRFSESVRTATDKTIPR